MPILEGTRRALLSELTWTPTKSLGGAGLPALWIDASFGTDTTTSGGVVASWTSRDSSAYAFTQATEAKKPTYQLNIIGSRPAIRFDGTDDILVHSAAILTGSSGAVFAVLRTPSSLSNFEGVITTANSAEDNHHHVILYRGDGTTPNLYMQNREVGAIDTVHGNTTIAADTNYICCWASSGTAYDLRLNGTDDGLNIAAGTDSGDWWADIVGPDNVSLGARQETAENLHGNMDLAELIVYDGTALTDDEKAIVERYLGKKYGITVA